MLVPPDRFVARHPRRAPRTHRVASIRVALVALMITLAGGRRTVADAASPPEATVQATLIERTYFGSNRVPAVREAGYAAIRRVDDAATLFALARTLSDERDDVRGVLLEHLAASDASGQAILAWIAIADDDPRLRGAAAQRLTVPADPAAVGVIGQALADGSMAEIDRAAELAAWIEATELIAPLIRRLSNTRVVLIEGFGRNRVSLFGDGRTLTFVDSGLLAPETIPGASGRLPGLGRTGVFLGRGSERPSYRVIESPRPAVHRSLLALSRLAYGPDAPDFGVDQAAWWRWLADVEPAGPPRP